jgi:hypothetical protein
MSHVSISRSYAVLVGLEAYVKTRRKVKNGAEHVKNAETRIMHPEEYEKMKEEKIDKSKSAEKERQILAQTAEKEEAQRKERSWKHRMWKRISGSGKEETPNGELTPKELEKAKDQKRKKWLSKSGLDVESGIPPDGKRDGLNKTIGDDPAR